MHQIVKNRIGLISTLYMFGLFSALFISYGVKFFLEFIKNIFDFQTTYIIWGLMKRT